MSLYQLQGIMWALKHVADTHGLEAIKPYLKFVDPNSENGDFNPQHFDEIARQLAVDYGIDVANPLDAKAIYTKFNGTHPGRKRTPTPRVKRIRPKDPGYH